MTDLERGRERFETRAWASAHEAFSLADRAGPLDGDDLECFAISAYLIGRDDEYLELLQRAYQGYVAAGLGASAARMAFWLGLRLLFRGQKGHANGWLGRGGRLLEREPGERVEEGYLLLAVTQQHIDVRDFDAARASAEAATKIGERFLDVDLHTVAQHLLGRLCLQQGRVAEGLALLDEAMLAATGGELSPIVTGLVYCSVIDGCREVFALGRAREWTSALARFCEAQPEMVAFTGICSIHRAEILAFHGAWTQALAEAERATTRAVGTNQVALGAAFYLKGEVHRLRGEFGEAEDAYRSASQWGREPQPGLSLVRLAEGRRSSAAASSIRRSLGATNDSSQRVQLLPAYIDVMLATGSAEEARSACSELDAIAREFDSEVLRAHAEQGRGAVELAAGNALAALEALRTACKAWQELEAPYLAARTRALMGECCRALGDEEGGRLELFAARTAFERLRAVPDIALVDSLTSRRAGDEKRALTAREFEVLRLIAAGSTNKAIAAELSLSEKTVERHVSNIFTKLEVPSRTAATAYAYQHQLV